MAHLGSIPQHLWSPQSLNLLHGAVTVLVSPQTPCAASARGGTGEQSCQHAGPIYSQYFCTIFAHGGGDTILQQCLNPAVGLGIPLTAVLNVPMSEC